MAEVIAALYVQRGGCYWDLPDVDPWDEARDARLYPGPHPVVAHPPCSRWCRLAGLVEARWGHKRGEDGGCFAAALASVRTWGGVLEHPAYTDAWAAFSLPVPPRTGGWTRGLCGGWTAHVEQGRYGHPAKKATWLYAFGASLPSLRWGYSLDSQSQALVSWCGNHVKSGESRPRVGKSAAARTPPEFRDLLLGIARSAAVGSLESTATGGRVTIRYVEVGNCPRHLGELVCAREEGHRGLCRARTGRSWKPSHPGRKRYRTVEYACWQQMNQRCHNPKRKGFEFYGGRGIRVCAEWRGAGGFRRFLEEVGRRPGAMFSIGRIDNDRGYEPGNVRWETHEQQVNNRTVTVWIEHDGRKLTASQWARETGLHVTTILWRLRRGWPANEVVNPARGARRSA